MSSIDLRLIAHAYGGDSLGRLEDGRAVFVPFTLPGELARVRISEDKRSYARAELIELLEPAPARDIPRCPHFMQCGGCHYQHMSYPEQLAAKSGILRDQLERIGGFTEIPLLPIIHSPEIWEYRNHIQFHLAPDGRLGFQAARSNEIVPIQECHLPEATLNRIWPQLDIEPAPGLERVGLRLGAGEEVMLVLESSDPSPLEFDVEELPISAVHLGPGGALVMAGSDSLVMEVRGRPFQVSAGAFFQVNTAQAGALVAHLLDQLPLTPGLTIMDVYCGVGLFSAFLAPFASRLIGVELDPQACTDYVANLDEFDHVELYTAPAEVVFRDLEVQPDILILDPPRAGLTRPVIDGILARRPPCLAYISCDPATLARDAKRLAVGGYRLVQVAPFDLFPQTFHIESVSIWRLA